MNTTMLLKKDIGTKDKVHPKKFAMWLFIISVVMLFAALTSAYVVKQSSGEWLDFDLPLMFGYTTGVILLSSVFVQMAWYYAKKDEIKLLRLMLVLTGVTGFIFLAGQWMAWEQLVEVKAYWVGNVAGSFIYVLTGMHGLHLISALIFVVIVILSAYKYKVHSKNLVQLEMFVTYWHFLGGLWLYLYLFLTLNH